MEGVRKHANKQEATIAGLRAELEHRTVELQGDGAKWREVIAARDAQIRELSQRSDNQVGLESALLKVDTELGLLRAKFVALLGAAKKIPESFTHKNGCACAHCALADLVCNLEWGGFRVPNDVDARTERLAGALKAIESEAATALTQYTDPRVALRAICKFTAEALNPEKEGESDV
jgi:hypothetical protein